ncbi:MAG: hypothetical protein JWM04_179, partial [Verrucomicrobiales bacterium]|nr:hypothetical protein [Verrucomicrobiales bacterium]
MIMQLNVNWNSIPKMNWTDDESLKQLHYDLENRLHDVKVLSFDFFDTLVCRFAAEPVAVFIEIGRRLLAEKLLPAHYTGESFQQLRIFAEEQCRARRTSEGAEEISLEEIYAEMREVLPNPRRAARIEVEVECEFCFVNPMTFGLLQYARKKGLKVIVLSDIYLSASHLKEILRANEVDPSLLDLLLTSRDEGVCKGTGDLFRLGASKLGVKANQIVHIGDNFHADVQGARKAGVKGYHYYRTTPLTDKIFEREKVLGDKGYAYSLDSVRLMARRMCSGGAEAEFRKEGAFLLGPVMASYAAWAVETFKELQITNVVALMREGELLALLMKRYADSIGYELTLHPIFVSRQATNLASLGQLTPEIFLQRSQRRSKINVEELFRGFGLQEEEFKNCGIPLDRTISSTMDLVEVSQFVFSPVIKDKIEQRSAVKRAELLGYLKPFIAKGEKNGLVDLGWGGTIQRNLQHAFDLENWNVTLTGCYLATNRGASVQILNGLDIRSYLGFLGAPSHLLQAFLRSPEIIEQSLSACMGSTVGYSKRGSEYHPVLEENRNTREESRQKYAFQEGVILFQQLLLSLASNKSAVFKSESAGRDMRKALFPILTRLIAFPLEKEALRYGNLNHDDNFGSTAWQPICGQKSRTLLKEEGLIKFISNHDYWPQGILTTERAGLGETFFSYENLFTKLRAGKSYKNPQIDLSIVLVCQGEAEALKNTLDRLIAHTAQLSVQTIIMENGADQNVSKVIQSAALKDEHLEAVLIKKRQSVALCQNQGAAHAKGNILFFFKPGCSVEAHTITSLAAQFDLNPGLGLICHAKNDSEIWLLIAVRKETFEEVGGFDFSYSTVHGNMDLMRRVEKAGWIISSEIEASHWVTNQLLEKEELARVTDRWTPLGRLGIISQAPLVSIVIPVFNKSHLTRCCLKNIERHTSTPYEVIVVDNASIDETKEMLEECVNISGNLQLISNEQNKGFSAACNAGAKKARGKYLLFLNNDTEVLPGWLEPLVEICEGDSQVAACGSKLLYPDHTIQHGGVWLTKVERVDPLSAIHAYAKQSSVYPPANELQLFSALTAACILIPKDKFEEVKGFDEGYWNGYEDIDLCLQFKRKGWLCVYEPKSVVIHLESQSGAERFKAVARNIERFHKKWLGKVEPELIMDAKGKVIDRKDSAVKPYNKNQNLGVGQGRRAEKVSIIILALNQLEHSRKCVESILGNTPEDYELVLVDNCSTDGTWSYFKELAMKHSHIRVIRNNRNLGFAAGNNQGITASTGDYLLFLNNDTVVTASWISRMLKVYDKCPNAGLVGPVSNCVSGPQLVLDANYTKPEELKAFAESWGANHAGQIAGANRLVGFCLMAKRSVIEAIGGLDERFGSGNFEDDDFCLRAGTIGFKSFIALDCFIHHAGSQTFKGAKIDYSKAMRRNWRLFKSKWGIEPNAPIESGYSLPLILNSGETIRVELPDLSRTHDAVERIWTDRSTSVSGKIVLPACALLGNLMESQELFRAKKWKDAWVCTCAAIDARPFHPEAFYLLAQIASGAGDLTTARRMCAKAREMAPGWAEPQKYLKGLSPSSRPGLDWTVTPMMNQNRVTVCFIAKNEEKFLSAALESARRIATQIILVDTGSADRTKEIATEYGAEVFHRDWIGDFSDARNFALEKATGDWVLVLDADEEVGINAQ